METEAISSLKTNSSPLYFFGLGAKAVISLENITIHRYALEPTETFFSDGV
jgi:hypothetical protein